MAENYYGITDTGKLRTNNEDTFIVQPVLSDQFIVACVIDGVGGYAGGEIAARLAHDAILSHLKNKSENIISMLKEAVGAANEAIYNEKLVSKANEQMACVLTIALVDITNNKFFYCHVGDTRLYLFRDNSLIKITKDHSFVGFLEDSGRLTEEAAMKHPKRNEINKALGFDAYIKTDDYLETGESPFLPGDALLLCSDGLSDMVANGDINAVLSTDESLSSKAQVLVKAANDAGGKDNITVVLVKNNKRPFQQTATKPVVTEKKNNGPGSSDAEKVKPLVPKSEPVTKGKKASSIAPFFIFLVILIVAAFLWILYQNYQNRKLHEARLKNTVIEKSRNPAEQRFIDSINGNKTNEVFVLNTPESSSIVITDSITVNNDSLHIIGNGTTLISDTAYKGPAFIVTSECKYLFLDSLTLENFDIGIITKNRGLHLRNVQFKNCRIPVQYNFLFKDRPVINGRFADTVFYNSDSVQNHY